MRLERRVMILIDVISSDECKVCDSCGAAVEGEIVKMVVTYGEGSLRNSIRLCKRCVRVLRDVL